MYKNLSLCRMKHLIAVKVRQMLRGSSPSGVKRDSLRCDSPRVSQICGVMQRAPPSHVSLVDVSGVLEQELAGDQGTLQFKKKKKKTACWMLNIQNVECFTVDIFHKFKAGAEQNIKVYKLNCILQRECKN